MVARYSSHDASATILSTTLNSLGDGANKITATAISNDVATTERRLFGNFRLSLAATATRTGNVVDMYILPEEAGTFASGSDSLDPESKYYAGSFSFDLTTNAREDILSDVRIPNSSFHVLLQNNIGVAFAATGTTLTYEKNGYEDV